MSPRSSACHRVTHVWTKEGWAYLLDTTSGCPTERGATCAWAATPGSASEPVTVSGLTSFTGRPLDAGRRLAGMRLLLLAAAAFWVVALGLWLLA